MIDIHCHILPHLDDGTTDMDEALNMAKQAVSQGVHTIIATPHHRDGKYNNDSSKIVQAVNELNNQLLIHKIPLTILPGQEIRLYDDLLEDLEAGNISKLASSRYLLIEFPSSYVPQQYEYLFHELILMNFVPIVAHPERNTELLENEDLLVSMIEMGALIQVTSASVSGKLGRKIQKKSQKWCKNGWVHFLASDAHNCKSRPFDLEEGYKAIHSAIGGDYVHYLQVNADKLINNEIIGKSEVRVKKKFFIW